MTELARAHIANVGGTDTLGDYAVTTLRGRSSVQLDRRVVQRQGKVERHPRLSEHVWHLVAKSLTAVGYGRDRAHG